MSSIMVIKYKNYPCIGSYCKPKRLIQQIGDGSIIKRFDRTPVPKKPNDVVCPHFLELKWAYGCPFDCSWCYLKGTLRFLPTKAAPKIKSFEKIESHVINFFDETENNKRYPSEVLNTGEIADSLMFENNGHPFSKFIIALFDRQNKHKVLFLTKSIWIQNLLKLETDSLIMSFTLNASRVSGKWEKKAPPIRKRINAARQLAESGYPIRIRIDPIIPIKNWDIHYKELIDNTFSNFKPERITFGSLRGLQTTINNTKDKSWVKYLSENSNWGKKISSDIRYKMYSTLITYLRERYNYKNVALCKETLEMWDKLGMDYEKIKCNCVG